MPLMKKSMKLRRSLMLMTSLLVYQKDSTLCLTVMDLTYHKVKDNYCLLHVPQSRMHLL